MSWKNKLTGLPANLLAYSEKAVEGRMAAVRFPSSPRSLSAMTDLDSATQNPVIKDVLLK
jgi:hypothetical protein